MTVVGMFAMAKTMTNYDINARIKHTGKPHARNKA